MVSLLEDIAEEWRHLFGHYYVSNLGRIKGRHSIRKTQYGTGGYPIVHIKGKTYSIHRLVAKAFLPPDSGRPMVNHKDGNKSNNRVDNLEWCTKSENALHAYRLGLMCAPKTKNNAKISVEQVREIRASNEPSRVLSVRYGLGVNSIQNIRARRTWGDVE